MLWNVVNNQLWDLKIHFFIELTLKEMLPIGQDVLVLDEPTDL